MTNNVNKRIKLKITRKKQFITWIQLENKAIKSYVHNKNQVNKKPKITSRDR